jgi:hypothetical protein
VLGDLRGDRCKEVGVFAWTDEPIPQTTHITRTL